MRGKREDKNKAGEYEARLSRMISQEENLRNILELADDLCYDCLMMEYGDYEETAWVSKYIVQKIQK